MNSIEVDFLNTDDADDADFHGFLSALIRAIRVMSFLFHDIASQLA